MKATHLLGGLTLSLLLFVGAASRSDAAPILDGDVDLIVSIAAAADCPGCSAHELDVLERGVGMMLTEMRSVALSGDVCVAEASLVKDLALVTFEAYRSGAVAENRWRDGLRYKGRFAGKLTENTIDTMLLAYREAIAERLGTEILPGSIEALQTDIFASGQLSRLFSRMAAGDWQDTWLQALREQPVGFNPTVDTLLRLFWEGRTIYEEILIYSRVDAHWREAEMARISGLQSDFLVGSVEADRDQLVVDYRAAIAADPWTAMAAGCAAQAAEGFRQHAIELSQTIQFSGLPEKVTIIFHDDQGNELHRIEDADGITVRGGMPGIFQGLPPGATPPPFSPQPGDGGNTGGTEGPTSGGARGEQKKPCSRATEIANMAAMVGGKCPGPNLFANCTTSASYQEVWNSNCGPNGTLTNRPDPPVSEAESEVPPELAVAYCRRICALGGGTSQGYDVGGSFGFEVSIPWVGGSKRPSESGRSGPGAGGELSFSCRCDDPGKP